MRVIDASSLAKYVNREPNWMDVQRYLLEGCITIDLAIKEVVNSIWKRWFKKELNGEDAYRVFKGFIDNLMVKIVKQEDYMDEAFKISLRHGIPIYDSLYIALAKLSNLELVTSDKSQKKAADDENIRVIYIP